MPPWHFDRLRRARPRLRDDGRTLPLLGNASARRDLLDRLEGPERAQLYLVAGGAGTGKTALLDWLGQVDPGRTIDLKAVIDSLEDPPDPDGSDLDHSVDELRRPIARIADRPVLLYDDADHDFRARGLSTLAKTMAKRIGFALLVMATTTATDDDWFPLYPRYVSLDSKTVTAEEFDKWLEAAAGAVGGTLDIFTDALRSGLHGLSSSASDYRLVEYVTEMLLARHAVVKRPVGTDSLIRIVHDDPEIARFVAVPRLRVSSDRTPFFRRKDKTELLADVLLRVYERPEQFAECATSALPEFDRRGFELEAELSYRDAVTSVCVERSPLEVVQKLLGPAEVRREMTALQLDPSGLVGPGEPQAHTLVRGLGFSLIDSPEGLEGLRETLEAATGLTSAEAARPDLVAGAAANVVNRVKALLLDILNFWGTYIFGSVQKLTSEVNSRSATRKQLDPNRLTLGEVVRLIRFINEAAEVEEVSFRLASLGVSQPFTSEMLKSCDEFVHIRNLFEHDEFMISAAASSQLFRERLDNLVEVSTGIMKGAGGGALPTVIKLSEILFDEYSRRIFTGVDSGGKRVRFAITGSERDDLTVAAHYYILPSRRVSIDPFVMPRFGASRPVLFDDADAYERASSTQSAQEETLLELIQLRPKERVLDVGCGTGRLVVRVAQSLPQGDVCGLDVSPDMVRRAAMRADAAQLHNVRFVTAELLAFRPRQRFSLIISNSAMHWMLPPERAYERLFELLRSGGRIVVHQGGKGTYRGLRDCALNLIREQGGRTPYFQGWSYPAYYPSKNEVDELLSGLGFQKIYVVSRESDGGELPNLARDFAYAGLLPFLSGLPETEHESFRSEFIRRASSPKVDKYTHRLYIAARRP